MANYIKDATRKELRNVISECFDLVRTDITDEELELFKTEGLSDLATEFVEAINETTCEAEMMEVFLKSCGVLAIPIIKIAEQKGLDLETFLVDKIDEMLGKHIDEMCDEIKNELEEKYVIKEKDPV